MIYYFYGIILFPNFRFLVLLISIYLIFHESFLFIICRCSNYLSRLHVMKLFSLHFSLCISRLPGTETSRQTWNQMGRRLHESGRSTLDQDRREPQRMATPRIHQQHQDEKPSVPPGNDWCATRTSSESVKSVMHKHLLNNHAK